MPFNNLLANDVVIQSFAQLTTHSDAVLFWMETLLYLLHIYVAYWQDDGENANITQIYSKKNTLI